VPHSSRCGGHQWKILRTGMRSIPVSVALRQRLKSLISGTKGQVTRGDFARGFKLTS
jgi:hypothetical protein